MYSVPRFRTMRTPGPSQLPSVISGEGFWTRQSTYNSRHRQTDWFQQNILVLHSIYAVSVSCVYSEEQCAWYAGDLAEGLGSVEEILNGCTVYVAFFPVEVWKHICSTGIYLNDITSDIRCSVSSVVGIDQNNPGLFFNKAFIGKTPENWFFFFCFVCF